MSFASHYTAANDCTPSRAALLTGLHTHQTGCLITGGSTLDPGFPTWGTMLREQDYQHLLVRQVAPHPRRQPGLHEDSGALEPYGFAGGTFPSPDGAPGQGWRVDPHIVSQFENWFASTAPEREPWCTTVSFVNPHDIAWWYRWSDRVRRRGVGAERGAAAAAELRDARSRCPRARKPRLQRSLQDTAAVVLRRRPVQRPGDCERPGCPSSTST